jgi:hypothetical protein
MQAFRQLAYSTLVFLCVGCGTLEPPQEYDQLARRVLALTRAHDSAGLRPFLAPELTDSATQAQLLQLGDTLQVWAPDSVALIGSHVFRGEQERVELGYALDGPQRWGVATLLLRRQAGRIQLLGLRLFPRTQSRAAEAAANTFSFRNRSALHYILFIAMCCSVLFCFGSAIQVLRTPMPRRWWLALLALVASGTLQLNWTTGALRFVSTNFVFFFGGAMTKAGPGAPWILSVALPIGACVALWRRAAFLRRSRSSSSVASIARAEPAEPGAV